MKSTFVALLLPCALLAHAATPTPEDKTEQVEVRLLASVSHAYPGEEITVGLRQRIAPHWHTYWLNPGDSGVATHVQWTVPPGVKAGPLQWPAPHYFQTGDIGNHGYADEVTLLSQVTVPGDAKPGSTVPIQAAANWLVCKDICIPQRAQLTLNVPVVAATTPREGRQADIEAARLALPRPSPWTVHAAPEGRDIVFTFPAEAGGTGLGPTAKEVHFFPMEWGRVDQHAPQPLSATADGRATLRVPQGEAPLKAGEAIKGVVAWVSAASGQRVAYEIDLPLSGPAGKETDSAKVSAQLKEAGTLPWALSLALLGGLVLNLMPCVFPVLSIKALSLLQHSEVSPRRSRLHGLAYTAGVLLSFAALALVLIVLKAAGTQAGWGFQFQSPLFVLAVAYLMFAVGLNLSGVFTMGNALGGVGGALADKQGYSGSFFTGVLATVVATPCTAPFMGGAIGFALTQPPLSLLAVFLSLGFGLALPYLVLSGWPRLQNRLPRPGVWMERFKQALAFPMYGAAAWLVWVLAQQAGVDAVAIALAGMIALGFAAWLYEQTRQSATLARRAGTAVAASALAAALAGGHLALVETSGSNATASTDGQSRAGASWQAYRPEAFAALRAKGEPVFLNFTAAWCITCLVNERVALSHASVTEAFQRTGTHYLKGDWTNQDAAISDMLARFGRSGVPLYVYYAPGSDSHAIVLPQILTPSLVLSTLKDRPASVARAN